MTDKGTCKHGEFLLTDGCKECLAERRATTALATLAPTENPEIMSFYNESLRIKEKADERVIATVADNKLATDDLSIIAKVKKGMEEKRKDYLRPFQDHVKETNEAYKNLMEPIESALMTTKSKMLAYHQEQERIRREQEEINRKKLEVAKAEMKLKGELSESVNLVEVIPEAPKTVRTNMGSAGLTDYWKYEVVDFALLPDEYKVPDTAMLNSIAKKHHDQKQIAGVRFYNEPGITMRPK